MEKNVKVRPNLTKVNVDSVSNITFKMPKAARSVRFAGDDQSARKPPRLVSLSNGAMRMGPRGDADFGHALQDTKNITLGHARPTPNPYQDPETIKGYELDPSVNTIHLLPDHVQVLLHLRYEKRIPDDSMDDGTLYKFINALRIVDVVTGISQQRQYTPLEVATQLSVADQMIGLGPLETPDKKRDQYHKFCNPKGKRCVLIKEVHRYQFENLELACEVILAGLKSRSDVLKLDASPEEVRAYYQPLRKSYLKAQEARENTS